MALCCQYKQEERVWRSQTHKGYTNFKRRRVAQILVTVSVSTTELHTIASDFPRIRDPSSIFIYWALGSRIPRFSRCLVKCVCECVCARATSANVRRHRFDTPRDSGVFQCVCVYPAIDFDHVTWSNAGGATVSHWLVSDWRTARQLISLHWPQGCNVSNTQVFDTYSR